MLEYGKRIKELREKENVSQRQVAEFMGIKRSSYDHFEQQYDLIPIKRLNQVANFFNVSIDYLFGLTNKKNYINCRKEIDLDVSAKRLKIFRKENKITQIKLAEVVGTSPAVIVHHENKRAILATPNLYTVCSKYKISADYLLGRIDEPVYWC